jgi:hypothetical protein
MDSANYVLGSSGRRRHTERLTGAQAPGESTYGAEGSIAGTDDEIGVGSQRDTRITAPATCPFLPKPNPPQGALVGRIVSQEPHAYTLELLAPHPRVGIEAVEQVVECRHGADAN